MKVPRLLSLSALAGAFALAAATFAGAEEPVKGGTLIVGAETELGTRDPAVSESGAAARVNWLIYEGLVQRDLRKETNGAPPPIVPMLAESWEVSDDQLTYTFHTRKGVTFHDGSPFNAQAVEFNVRRVWDPNFEFYYKRGAGIPAVRYVNLKDVKAVDDNTVVFTLSAKNAFFISQLAECASPGLPSIVSPTAVKTYGNDEVANHPAGTGPFLVAEQAKGEYLKLARNPNYWDKNYPYVDELIFRQIPDATARVNALRAGEVDMIIGVPPDEAGPLGEEGFTIAKGPLPHIWYLSFNMQAKPFNDLRVRQAVSKAIDKQGMAHELLRDTAAPVFSLVSRTSPAYDGSWTEPYAYDVEAAKKLMADAGYADGFDTVFEISTSGSGQMIPVPMAEWIQRDLAKIGIRVTLRTYEWNTYIGRWIKAMEPDVGINQMSWGSNSDFWLQTPLLSTSWGNPGRVNDADIDKMINDMLTANSDDERIALARKIAQRTMENAYHLPIVGDQGTFALSAKVKGFVRATDWIEDYSNIWIAK